MKAPKNGGQLCEAHSTSELAECNMQQCEGDHRCIDGKWGRWGDWSECSATCGKGFMYRSRDIALPPNSCGKPLDGDAQEFKVCEGKVGLCL